MKAKIKDFNLELTQIPLLPFLRLYGHIVRDEKFTTEMFESMKGLWVALDGILTLKSLRRAVKNRRTNDDKKITKGLKFDEPSDEEPIFTSPRIV